MLVISRLIIAQVLCICTMISNHCVSQDWDWIKSCHSAADEEAYDLRYTDNALYVVGKFSTGCSNPAFDTISPFTIPISGGAFIAKYTHSGYLLWYKFIHGNNDLFSLDIGENEDLWLGGSFAYEQVIDGDTIYGYNNGFAEIETPFIARLDSAGNLIWHKSWVAISGGRVRDIRYYSPSKKVYIGGSFGYGLVVDGDTINAPNNGSQGLIMKLDDAGTTEWVKNYNIGEMWAMDIDYQGSVYTTGRFVAPITVGGTTLTSNGAWDIYIIKCNSSGNWDWAVSGGGSGDDNGRDIFYSQFNHKIYMAGSIGYNNCTFGSLSEASVPGDGGESLIVTKINPDNGNFEKLYYPELCDGRAVGLEMDADVIGNLYLTGRFGMLGEQISFGADTLVSMGNQNLFVLSLSPDLNYRWAVPAYGVYRVVPSGLDVSPNGDQIFMSGTFEGQDFIADTFNIQNVWPSSTEAVWGRIYTNSVVHVQHTYEKPFKLYPNPSQGLINIELTDNVRATGEVFNMDGKSVFSFDAFSKITQLDLRRLPAGVYLLVIENSYCRIILH